MFPHPRILRTENLEAHREYIYVQKCLVTFVFSNSCIYCYMHEMFISHFKLICLVLHECALYITF
jgi:hypothetical protein